MEGGLKNDSLWPSKLLMGRLRPTEECGLLRVKKRIRVHQDKCLSQDGQVFACTGPFRLRRLCRTQDVPGQAETIVKRFESCTVETRKQRVNVCSLTAISKTEAPLPIPHLE